MLVQFNECLISNVLLGWLLVNVGWGEGGLPVHNAWWVYRNRGNIFFREVACWRKVFFDISDNICNNYLLQRNIYLKSYYCWYFEYFSITRTDIWYISLHEKCPHKDQKKLRIWTLSTQYMLAFVDYFLKSTLMQNWKSPYLF